MTGRFRLLRGASALGVAVGLVAWGVPSRTEAYCILPESQRWTPPAEPIPVYVSEDGLNGTDVRDIGIGANGGNLDDTIRWVKAAIAIVNEAATDAPRLYYAGTDSNVEYGANFWSSRNPNAITISTFGPCSVQQQVANGVFAVGTHTNTTKRYAIRFISPKCGTGTGLWWVDPAREGEPGHSWDEDFVGVLVHELGHALGLQHTNISDPSNPSNCDQTFPAATTKNSVMNTADKHFRRRLRRDDVEALRALWGAPERSVRWYWSTAAEPSPLAWNLGAGPSSSLRVNTPVSLTSSSRTSDSAVLMAYADGANQIRYLRGTAYGWDAGTGTPLLTPGGQAITTFDRVAVSRGSRFVFFGADPTRIMVAWHGTDETTCCGPERALSINPDGPNPVHTRIWWRVHDGTGWTSPGYTSTTRYKELGLGYDPGSDMFLLAGVDTCRVSGGGCQAVADAPRDQMLWVRTIRGSDGTWACTEALSTAGHVLAVGDVSCDYRGFTIPASYTRCVIPVTTTETSGGPRLRYIEGEIRPHDGSTCFVRSVDPPTVADVLATGTPSTALDGSRAAANGSWLLGAFAPQFDGNPPQPGASGWSRIYTMARSTSTGWVVPPPENVRSFDSGYWPLSVGSLTSSLFGGVQWRVVGY